MTHEMALKMAQTETPEQMADRIVELYETIDDLRASLEQYRNGYQGSCMACEPVAEKNRKLEMQIDKTRKARYCAGGAYMDRGTSKCAVQRSSLPSKRPDHPAEGVRHPRRHRGGVDV